MQVLWKPILNHALKFQGADLPLDPRNIDWDQFGKQWDTFVKQGGASVPAPPAEAPDKADDSFELSEAGNYAAPESEFETPPKPLPEQHLKEKAARVFLEEILQGIKGSDVLAGVSICRDRQNIVLNVFAGNREQLFAVLRACPKLQEVDPEGPGKGTRYLDNAQDQFYFRLADEPDRHIEIFEITEEGF